MKNVLMLSAIVLAFCITANAHPCYEHAKVVAPVLSDQVKADFEKKLEDARLIALTGPNGGDVDSIIWYGRRTAYTGRYKDAIGIFTKAIKRWPQDARLYRHRGHRNITLRCFDDAIADLEKAASLIKAKPDEVEPDGIPNARNIPTSTLQSNIWYHLGLAYYFKGDFLKASKAYDECEKVSKNADMLVATKHWQYMTLRRLGKRDEALATVKGIPGDLDIIENQDYYKLVKLYKGTASGETLFAEFEAAPDNVSKASLGYGLGNRWLYHDKPAEAKAIFEKIVAGKQWASFGFIAAEVELRRMK